ncbi:hypothetical protein ACMYSQ_011048 [Aspergillus niger]
MAEVPGSRPRQVASPSSTIVHITGAKQGLGFDVAKKLATDHPGYHVFMGYRDATKGEEAVAKLRSRVTVDGVMMDVTDDTSILCASAGDGRSATSGFCVLSSRIVYQPVGPDDQFAASQFPVYRSSKTALNMVACHYASLYGPKGWKVNASDPGHCATNLNGLRGSGSPECGALQTVRLASLDKDGPNGIFSNTDGPLGW